MRLFEFSIFVNADPVEVFNVVSDPRSKLAWVPAIRRVELEAAVPPGLGTHYMASSGFGPFEFIFQEQITAWVENESVAYQGCSFWGEFETIVKLNPEGAGTRVYYCMEYSSPGGLLGEMLLKGVRLFIRRSMEVRAATQLKKFISG